MSIIAKFPWHRGEYYTVLQRDHLFEALKSIPPRPSCHFLSYYNSNIIAVAIETLRISMRKRPLVNLNNTLLDRLVKTGLLNVCFTERQKLSLLNVAGTSHPPPPSSNIFNPSMLELNFLAVRQSSPNIATVNSP